VVSREAKIAPDVKVGAYAVIEGAVTIGAGSVVQSMAKLMGPLSMGERNVVHTSAVLGDWPQDRKFKDEFSEVVIGDDNIFREGVTVHRGTGLNTKTVVGDRCYFMVNSHAGHNCVVGDDVTLVNGAVLGGHVTVGDRAIIGAYCAVHQFCRVGRLAMLSNSCCLTVDMPPFFITMSTNTITQLNAVGIRRSGMPRESINGIRKMFQVAFRDHHSQMLSRALKELPEELLSVPEVREVVDFCKASKRGVALFQPWSQRNVTGGDAASLAEGE
jgi:UDP-N-acetylglucosamine acyltransferase